jgi:protein-disulfide isomerase
LNARPDLCEQVGVKAYPTWIVNGERREGVQSLDQLAELSHFRFQSELKAR